jgi:hypothetical protein
MKNNFNLGFGKLFPLWIILVIIAVISYFITITIGIFSSFEIISVYKNNYLMYISVHLTQFGVILFIIIFISLIIVLYLLDHIKYVMRKK